MNFNWKNIVGLILIVAGTVVGFVFKVPVAVISSIVAVVAGATLAIVSELKKTTLNLWQSIVFVVTIIGGTILLTLGGYADSTIISIVGAVILLASVIAGIAVNAINAKKEA